MALTTLPSLPAMHTPQAAEFAALLAAVSELQPKYVQKTSETQYKQSDTALANDDTLVVQMAANAKYRYELGLFIVGNEAGDFKFGFTFPTGAVLNQLQIAGFVNDSGLSGGNTSATVEYHAILAASSPSLGLSIGNSTTPLGYLVEGTITTAATAGAFQLQWAQATSNATQTKVKSGSWIELRRVA